MTATSVVGLLLWLLPHLAHAQASLAAEDMIDEVPVTIAGVKESFTLIRDAHRAEQWYYVPDRPRLFERSLAGGPVEPDFALLRYQFDDPGNAEKLFEGGLMQFALSLSLPAEAIPQLKKAIAATKTVPAEKIRLAALPFEAATVHLYVPQSGDLVASTPQGPGIAPTFATSEGGLFRATDADRVRRVRRARERQYRPRRRGGVRLQGPQPCRRLHHHRRLGSGLPPLQQRQAVPRGSGRARDRSA